MSIFHPPFFILAENGASSRCCPGLISLQKKSVPMDRDMKAKILMACPPQLAERRRVAVPSAALGRAGV